MGGFRLPYIKWLSDNNFSLKTNSSNSQVFVDLISEFNITQLVHESTHIKGNILELILYTKPQEILNTTVIKPDLIDHHMIEFEVIAHKNCLQQTKQDRYIN